jgi:hypothetical protein
MARIAEYNYTLIEGQANTLTVKYPGISDLTGYSVEAKIYSADSVASTVLAEFDVGTMSIDTGRLVIPLTLSEANTETVIDRTSNGRGAFYRIKLIPPSGNYFFFLKGKITQEQNE